MTAREKVVLEDHHVMWDRATVLGVIGLKSNSAFYRAIKEDGLPKPIRIGRLAKWRKSEVLEWLDSRPQGLEHEFQ